MNQNKTFLRVAQDMFITQFNWTIAFLGIFFIINIVKLITAGFNGNDAEGFFNSVFVAGSIYMLIIGIIAIYFLPHFVGNGVTRKDYFLGTILASIGLSISIPIITILIFILEKFVLNVVNMQYKVQTINELELDGNIIGDIVQSIIISPYVDPNENWLLAISVLSLNIFISYMLGWFISTSFYRYEMIFGLISIFVAIVLKMLKDTLLRISLDLPTLGWFTALDFLPISLALMSILLVIFITLYFIRNMTKRVPIKM